MASTCANDVTRHRIDLDAPMGVIGALCGHPVTRLDSSGCARELLPGKGGYREWHAARTLAQRSTRRTAEERRGELYDRSRNDSATPAERRL